MIAATLLILLLLIALPTAFALGSIAVIMMFVLWGPSGLDLCTRRLYTMAQDFALVSVPLFVLMGTVLEKSEIAEDLYAAMHVWSGGIPGGLAVGTVLICMLFAAMTGLSAGATVTMGLVALPQMLSRGYSKELALGPIAAGGALGVLIPPSVTMILYAMIAQVSVGRVFMGGVVPGVILGLFFICYILLRGFLQPHLVPALPLEERFGWREKISSLKKVILPIALIIIVMGSIFAGIAAPTEAAAVGAAGAFLCAAVSRKFNWELIKESSFTALRVTSMAMWIYLGSTCFTTFVVASGLSDYISSALLQLPGGKWGVMISIQIVWLILGAFIDPWGIMMITAPIFCPVVKSLGFDLVWFGVIFVINMEMAFLTPPFGFNLFYLKGVTPEDISMTDIMRSVWAFVGCQALCLIVFILCPWLVLWLPGKMGI